MGEISMENGNLRIPRPVAILLLALLACPITISIVVAKSSYNFPVYPTRNYIRPLVSELQVEFNSSVAEHDLLCSIGYFVERGNFYGLISAAHCQVKGANIVYQPNATSNRYIIGAPVESSASSRDIDAILVKLNNNVGLSASVVYITGKNSYIQVAVTGYGDWNVISPYVKVYKTGRTTGTTCGEILYKKDNYLNLTDVIVTNVLGAGGDSGSPLYYSIKYTISVPETYILGHISKGIDCKNATVNGEKCLYMS